MTLGQTIRQQTDDIIAACDTVEAIANNTVEYGRGTVNPPCAVVGPPAVDWSGQGPAGVTTTRRLVYVVAAADDQAMDTLLDLIEPVGDAIEQQVTDAVVLSASPGTYLDGATELPAYELTVETSLP